MQESETPAKGNPGAEANIWPLGPQHLVGYQASMANYDAMGSCGQQEYVSSYHSISELFLPFLCPPEL